MQGSWMIDPTSQQQDILKKIHTGHQKIVKCHKMARQSVWWPGLLKDLDKLMRDCEICCEAQVPHLQLLIVSKLPQVP